MTMAELAVRPAPGAAAVTAHAAEIRRQILRVVAGVGEGYLLQGLGAADILAALYFSELRLDPARPGDPDQDRCLLCTAHNSVAMYSTLALRGFFPVTDLDQYGQDGSPLEIISAEPVPGVEGTFGSLGQGLSVAVGMALRHPPRGERRGGLRRAGRRRDAGRPDLGGRHGRQRLPAGQPLPDPRPERHA